MQASADRSALPVAALRIALAAFVLAWIFGPYQLRSSVPVLLVFLIALGLEIHFFVGVLKAPTERPERDRGPQAVDRERFGYPHDVEDPYEEELDDADDLPLPPAGRRRPGRRLLVGLGLIGALALLLWVVESRTGWAGLSAETRAEATARFSAEASRVAAKPVAIRCDESGQYVGAVQHADGVAKVGGDLAFLTPERCLDLYRLAFDGEVRGSRTGRALAVLAHEAWHLRGVRDEGTTECYALQSGVELGRRLGLSLETARGLMRQQLAENRLHERGSAEYLLPAGCRDGGELDLDADDPEFP
ncbi:MAG: hypothetical protein ICV67_03925 [Thermoleophilia bacterium]|nr:hypothetical protein [Thermoleophilia bacterium]